MGGPQAYNAMKASLITYGKQLALAHGKDGIRVNVVSPGPIEFEGGNWDMIKGSFQKVQATLAMLRDTDGWDYLDEGFGGLGLTEAAIVACKNQTNLSH